MISLKHIVLTAAAVFSLTIVSCGDKAEKADKELKELAAANKNADPSVTYVAKTLTYRYTVPASTFKRINVDNLKAKTLGELKSMDNKKLVQTLTEANANVQYIYVCDNDSVVFSFKPADFVPVKK